MSSVRTWRILSLILVHVVNFASGTVEHDIAQVIDDIVPEFMRCRDIPGLGLTVVVKDRTIVQNGYGLADIENNIPLTENTLFAIASVGKHMTSTVLAMLMHERGVRWGTRVKDILGDDFALDSDFVSNTTTINDILSHRSGIVSSDTPWLLGVLDREQLYRRLRLTDKKFTVEFRDKVIYNNVVYTIAGKLIEHLGGKPWEALMVEKLFRPLNMHSTTFYNTAGPTWSGFAKTYVKFSKEEAWVPRDSRVIRHVGAVGPAGSISSNVEDMAKYMHFFTSGGKSANNKTLLPARKLKEIYYPIMTMPQPWLGGAMNLNSAPVKLSMDDYARGLVVGWYRGNRMAFHPGNLIGQDNLITHIPGINSAIYSATNGPSSVPAFKAHALLHSYITDLLLGVTPWLNKTTICTYPQPWGKANDFYSWRPFFNFSKTIPFSREINDYLGKFGHSVLGNVTFIKGTSGRLQMNYGDGRFVLYPQKEKDLFYFEALEPFDIMPEMNSKFYKTLNISFHSVTDGVLDRVELFVDFRDPPAPVFSRFKGDVSGTKRHSTTLNFLACVLLFSKLLSSL